MKRTAISLCFGFMWFCPASGQGIADSIHNIGTVSILGGRLSGDAAVSPVRINSASLAETAGLSLAELLSKHSNVFVKSYGAGSLATVSFRGMASSHTQVIWNGININNPMLGDMDFSLVPVWLVDRAGLYYGGSSLVVGSGALGGTIVLDSEPTWNDNFYGTAIQGVGSFGSRQSFASLGGGSRKFQVRVRYLYQRADNGFPYYNHALDPSRYVRQHNAGYSRHGGAADIFWNAGKNNILSLNLWCYAGDVELPSTMEFAGTERNENRNDLQLRAVFKWSKYGERFRSEFTGGFSSVSLGYVRMEGNELWESSLSDVTSYHLGYVFDYSFSGATLLKIKLNVSRHDAAMNNRKISAVNKFGRNELDMGVSIHHSFSSRLEGYALVRGNAADGGFAPPMPSIGLEYKPAGNDKLTLRLNAARNYHRPTLNDLYWQPGGNPDLHPEKGYTADLSAGYRFGSGLFRYSFSVTGYASWIDDWIVWNRDSRNSYYSTPVNMKKVFSRGSESVASISYSANGLNVTATGNYAFVRATEQRTASADNASVSKQLIYMPVHSANAMLDVSYRGWYLWWVWSVVGERFIASGGEGAQDILPAYDLHDATAGKKFRFWRLNADVQLKANNIFGRRYSSVRLRPMPEQNFNLSVKISF